MEQARISSIPLYPEGRARRRPTADQVFRLFSLAEQQILLLGKKVVQIFEEQLT